MSVAEVIEKIKALPPGELVKLIDYMKKNESEAWASAVKYVAPDKANDIADKVFTENETLFRKLAG